MRKLNTILVVVIIAMLGLHSISAALYLAGLLKYSPSFQITGRRVFMVLCVHIIISLGLFIKDSLKRRHIKVYQTLTKESTYQVLTGILIIVFMTLHVILYSISSAATLPDSQTMIFAHWLVDLVFISVIMWHLLVSLPRFIISLGLIATEQTYEKAKKVIQYVISVIWIGFILAEVIFYFWG